ncbi:MAG: AAA family ATPase [Candidatus Micrarchaeia archaeon]
MAEEGEEQKTQQEQAKDHWRQGNSFFQEGNFEEAKDEYTKAIEIKSDYADAYFNRALTEKVLNEPINAMHDLEKVIELQPNSHDAPFLMGDIAEARNDLIGARYWYERSLNNNPAFLEAKKKLEEIDMKMHINTDETSKEEEVEISTPKKNQTYKKGKEEEKDIIEEGQIKKVAFYKSNLKFDSVIGSKKVKEYLYDNVVLAIQHPELFKKYGKKLGVGLLMYGPPGVGKTYMVNAIAGEAGANVIIARINQIVDMYTGNTEKNLHAIFQQARENIPCIIFFDELDALGIKRGGGSPQGESSSIRLAVNQFLTEMNGVEANPEGIFVIGATNQPWDIDPALKRSGRFGDSIYIPPPKYRERVELFKFYTRNKPKGRLNYGRLARATMGYTPADIERICDKAAMRPLLHEHKYNKERRLNMSDMLAILKDKDMSGSTLDEWYSMVKKDVISVTETQVVDGKKQQIVKEGKLDPQEKILYRSMIKDIKKNTSGTRIWIKKAIRWFAVHFF